MSLPKKILEGFFLSLLLRSVVADNVTIPSMEPSLNPSNSANGNDGLSKGWIFGIVCGCILLFVCFATIIYNAKSLFPRSTTNSPQVDERIPSVVSLDIRSKSVTERDTWMGRSTGLRTTSAGLNTALTTADSFVVSANNRNTTASGDSFVVAMTSNTRATTTGDSFVVMARPGMLNRPFNDGDDRQTQDAVRNSDSFYVVSKP